MIESKPISALPEEQAHPAPGGLAPGALAVAGLATAIVVAIWLAFYFLIFVPRAPVP